MLLVENQLFPLYAVGIHQIKQNKGSEIEVLLLSSNMKELYVQLTMTAECEFDNKIDETWQICFT